MKEAINFIVGSLISLVLAAFLLTCILMQNSEIAELLGR